MKPDIVDRVLDAPRYRALDRALVARLAAEELPKARNADDAVKRVKRRLHQVVGAFRPAAGSRARTASWPADDPDALRAACLAAMAGHASSRERIAHLDRFHAAIWERTGVPVSLLDLGCGLHPLALPWMGIGPARYHAIDGDAAALVTVGSFLAAVGQPHVVEAGDLVGGPPAEAVDVALLLKLVTTLDRQDPTAAGRLLRRVAARHAVVSFAARSLGGAGRGREQTYRRRLDRLVDEAGRVVAVAEASVPNELVFVLSLEPLGG